MSVESKLSDHYLRVCSDVCCSSCQFPFSPLILLSVVFPYRRLVQGMGPMGRPKITTGLDKVRREIELMRQVWHPNVLVLESVIDDPDEDALILVLEYAPQGQVMMFDPKKLKYKNHIFGVAGSPSPAPTNNVALASPPAAAPASSSSSSSTSTAATATFSHDKPISESILRKILHDVLAGLEYCQSTRHELFAQIIREIPPVRDCLLTVLSCFHSACMCACVSSQCIRFASCTESVFSSSHSAGSQQQ